MAKKIFLMFEYGLNIAPFLDFLLVVFLNPKKNSGVGWGRVIKEVSKAAELPENVLIPAPFIPLAHTERGPWALI